MTIDSTTKINVDTASVVSVVAEVQNLYKILEEKIKDLNMKKEGIPDYWTSVEASNFVEQMDKISTYFENFSEHYVIFINSIETILDLYDKEEESIISAINTYKGVN